MKLFEKATKGTEIEFINEDGKKERALIDSINDKTFTIKVLRNSASQGWYNKEIEFYLSGKKKHHRYTHGNAIKLVCDWNKF